MTQRSNYWNIKYIDARSPVSGLRRKKCEMLVSLLYFCMVLTAYLTILPSCIDVYVICKTNLVTSQVSLNHISLFLFACVNLIHGLFVEEEMVFFCRNVTALMVSLMCCLVRIYYSSKLNVSREVALDAVTLLIVGTIFIFAQSDFHSNAETIDQLMDVFVAISSNFNVLCSTFPLVFRVVPLPKKSSYFHHLAGIPLFVNSVYSVSSLLYALPHVNNISFYSDICACLLCAFSYSHYIYGGFFTSCCHTEQQSSRESKISIKV